MVCVSSTIYMINIIIILLRLISRYCLVHCNTYVHMSIKSQWILLRLCMRLYCKLRKILDTAKRRVFCVCIDDVGRFAPVHRRRNHQTASTCRRRSPSELSTHRTARRTSRCGAESCRVLEEARLGDNRSSEIVNTEHTIISMDFWLKQIQIVSRINCTSQTRWKSR